MTPVYYVLKKKVCKSVKDLLKTGNIVLHTEY